MIPHIAMFDLDPYALALYCQYKKVVAENPDGKCYMTNRKLAKECKMSVTRMKKAREELERRNYIELIQHPDENGVINAPATIILRNLWTINQQICEVEYKKKPGGGYRQKTGGIATR